ncbi:MAG: ATP-binding protein [Calditrichia bacterium]
MDTITLSFTRDLEYLRLATVVSSEICTKLIADQKISENFKRDLELVICEAAANAIKHGGESGGRNFAMLTFEIGDSSLKINVRDQGKGFDIGEIPEPDFDSVPEGGYGIYIMRTIMDDVSYNTGDDGWNTLTLIKNYDVTSELVVTT